VGVDPRALVFFFPFFPACPSDTCRRLCSSTAPFEWFRGSPSLYFLIYGCVPPVFFFFFLFCPPPLTGASSRSDIPPSTRRFSFFANRTLCFPFLVGVSCRANLSDSLSEGGLDPFFPRGTSRKGISLSILASPFFSVCEACFLVLPEVQVVNIPFFFPPNPALLDWTSTFSFPFFLRIPSFFGSRESTFSKLRLWRFFLFRPEE